MSFVRRLFGKTVVSAKSPAKTRSRRLHMEALEQREMLSVTTTEFAALRTQYADLELSENKSDYHVIEITAAELTASKLAEAITEAGTTADNDLIVLRTTETQNRLTLTGSELAIAVSASSRAV